MSLHLGDCDCPLMVHCRDWIISGGESGGGARAAVRFARMTVKADEDMVFVHGDAGVALGNGDFGLGGIVRLEKTFAGPVHTDAAGDEVRLARLDIATALGADDLALLFQISEGLLQRLLLAGTQAQELKQLGDIGRSVVVPAQQT